MQNLQLFNEWREEYLQRTYLRHDSEEQLIQRQADLMDNILTIDAGGGLIIDEGEQFRRLLAHVHAEFEFRNVRIPGDFMQRTYSHHARAAELWGRGLPENRYLLKFGSFKHMDPLFKQGRIRIANAKNYDDPSLNPAIRDCEVMFTEECYGTTVDAPPNSPYAVNGQSTRMDIIGNVRRVAKSSTDYYVACFGMRYDYRLFDDFSRGSPKPYDSCLVIPTPQAFIDRMRECGKIKLPGWDLYESPVTYRDPHHPVRGPRPVDVVFTKHFRYAWQREYRLAWLPPNARDKLEPVEFVLGPLDKCCRFLTL
jgi:hypothetical protein